MDARPSRMERAATRGNGKQGGGEGGEGDGHQRTREQRAQGHDERWDWAFGVGCKKNENGAKGRPFRKRLAPRRECEAHHRNGVGEGDVGKVQALRQRPRYGERRPAVTIAWAQEAVGRDGGQRVEASTEQRQGRLLGRPSAKAAAA